MGIDERIVDCDAGMRRGDITNASHVGRQVIDLIDLFGHLHAFGIVSQVRDNEFVGVGFFEFRIFEVGAAHDVAALGEILDEMVTDKSPCAGH